MGAWGKCDFGDFERLEKQMRRLERSECDRFCRSAAKELAARLLARLVKRTPVAENTGSHIGGTLRRGWKGGEMRVESSGGTYSVELENPTEYGIYVNYGHRTPNGGWVDGQYFVEMSVDEIQKGAGRLVERRLRELLERAFR
jgi:hypothetical protein